ncbi:MAG TPA: cysteine desulfurase NifS, partial [Syntrophales bacterium]|nr:cysteine desulfurase NifS [Syntrophales bacterium]
ACTAGTVVISHVMEALGVPREWAAGSIRFSLGRENTVAEMDAVVAALTEVTAKLRGLSELERSRGQRGCI